MPRYLIYGNGEGRDTDALLDGLGLVSKLDLLKHTKFKLGKDGMKLFDPSTWDKKYIDLYNKGATYFNDFLDISEGVDFIYDTNELIDYMSKDNEQ